MTPRLRLGDVAGGTRTARVGGGIPGEVGYGPPREEAVGWGLWQDPPVPAVSGSSPARPPLCLRRSWV